MKIAVFFGSGQYNVARFMLDQLADGLAEAGRSVVRIEADSHLCDRIRAVVLRGVTTVIGYNGFGSDLLDAAAPGPGAAVRFVGWLVDHPAYHALRIDAAPPSALFCCVDATHLDYMTMFGGNRPSEWLPHFACRVSDDLPHAGGRDVAVLCPGTYRSSRPQLAEIERWLEPRRGVALDSAAMLTARGGLPVHQAVLSCMKEASGEAPSQTAVHEIVRAVDGYVRSRRRELCLQSLASAGVRATVCGHVDRDIPELAGHDILPACDGPALVRLMQRARVVVDPGAGFVRGGHERGLTAMAAGAALVCERNAFWSAEFTDGQDYLGFAWDDVAAMGVRVRSVLEQHDTCAAMANHALGLVERRHLAVHRAERLLQFLR